MEIPKISEGMDLTLAEAKLEYQQLKNLQKKENRPKYGWADWLERKIEERLTSLRMIITDIICEVKDERD